MTIFISHSSKDAALVRSFCSLLTERMNINEEDIFCTSLNHSLSAGENFIVSIRKNLESRDIIIFLITEHYKESIFCIMEMGAAWALSDNIIPIIVPPLDFTFLYETPLQQIEAIRLNSFEDIMYRFYENKLCKSLDYPRLSSSKEDSLKNAIHNFIDTINTQTQSKFNYNLDEVMLRCAAQNGNPEAVTVVTKNNEHIVNCDFSCNSFYPIMSNFLSCYLKFSPHRDWSDLDSNWRIEFELSTENNSIHELILEIKSGHTLEKVFEIPIKLENEYKKYSIELNKTKISMFHLKQISEICFVVRPHTVNNFKGVFKLRNICGTNK